MTDFQDFGQQISETVREPMLVLDADFRVCAANRSFYRMFKEDEAATINHFIYDLGNGQWNSQRLREWLNRVLEGQPTPKNSRIEHHFEHVGQGSMILNARKVFRPDNHTHSILLAVEDVTQHHHHERKNDEAREIAENIVDTVRQPLLVLDRNLQVITANRFFYKTFQVDATDVVGYKVQELGNGQWNIPTLLERLDRILHDQPQLEDLEISHEFESIGHRTMLLNARKMYRPGNHSETILVAIEDVTERIASLKAVEAVNRLLQQKNDEMEQFVYVVSHDLKSPLVTLSGFLGMLRQELAAGRSEKLEHYLSRLDLAVKRMGELIEDLLNLSRAGQARGELTEVSLSAVTQEAAESLSAMRQEKAAVLHIDPDMPHVMADAQRLSEVIQNLLENAFKYGCPEPGCEVSVNAELGPEEVRLSVRDNGAGVPSHYQERIFRLFERLDNHTEGTGVGLALVARVAQTHGGKAWVESTPGQGATFYFALPVSELHTETTHDKTTDSIPAGRR